jgi:hypothetical protein
MHNRDMKFVKTLLSKLTAKVVSESSIVISIASSSRLRPSKANSLWSSPAMRDGCTELLVENFSILNHLMGTWQTSGKK